MEIHRERTAMSRKSASAPTKWAYENSFINPVVFDWGCGKGQDSKWLQTKGIEVISFDPFFCDENPPDSVNFKRIRTVLLIYVMNVIENIDERECLLYDVANLTRKNSNVIISVPRNKSIESRAEKSKWKKFSDGFITKNKTFQKGYTLGEFADECSKVGKIEEIKKLSGSLVGVVKIKR